MNHSLTRLILVLSLALMASAVRADNREKRQKAEEPRPILAGMGFVSFPEPPKKESVRIIYSDEEIEIVDMPDAPKK